MYNLPELDAIDVACGQINWCPKMSAIPDKFNDFFHNKHCKIAAKLFYKGGSLSAYGMSPRAGVNIGKATLAIGALLRSFEPKHEHKMSIAGYLIDQWFEPTTEREYAHEPQHAHKKG